MNTNKTTISAAHPHRIFDNDNHESRMAWRSLVGTIYQLTNEIGSVSFMLNKLKDCGFRIDLQVDKDGRFVDICEQPRRLSLAEWRDLLGTIYLIKDSFLISCKAIETLGKSGISIEDYFNDLYRHHAEDDDSNDGQFGTRDS